MRKRANHYAGMRVFAPAAACSAKGTQTAVDSKYDMPHIATSMNSRYQTADFGARRSKFVLHGAVHYGKMKRPSD